MSEAREVKFTDGDVEWAGQTITDGGEGRVLFGRDSKGALHIEIVCDHTPTGGIVQKNRCELPNGVEFTRWLNEWFDPPRVTVVGSK